MRLPDLRRLAVVVSFRRKHMSRVEYVPALVADNRTAPMVLGVPRPRAGDDGGSTFRALGFDENPHTRGITQWGVVAGFEFLPERTPP